MVQEYDDKDPLAVRNDVPRRVDLPPEAYVSGIVGGPDCHPFELRPGFNTTHAPIKLGVNQYRVNAVKLPTVYQYDVSIHPEPKGAIVYKKAWETTKAKTKLKQYQKGPWIYDQRKIAWSVNDVPEIKLQVDLGEDEGRPGRPNQVMMLIIKKTGKINLEALNAYLDNKMGWDNTVLECMSFFDHVIRQGPSENWRLIKRVLFNNSSETERLNNWTEAIKGIYSAIRINSSKLSGGFGLGINVDVSNQTFFVGQDFHQLAKNMLTCLDKKWETLDYPKMIQALYPVKVPPSQDGKKPGFWAPSDAFVALRRLYSIKFRVTHRGKENDPKEYKVLRFMFDPKYGQDGATAKAVKFSKKMPDGTTKEYDVFSYYIESYRKRLTYWQLPLIETVRGGCFPMEVCVVDRFNPYPFKLDPQQTQEMIKFAVQRPPQRKQEIITMVQNLNWASDRYLNHFGIQVNPNMPMVEARLIPNPTIQFAQRVVDPKMMGRWDLRGQKFVKPNAEPLRSWAFVTIGKYVDRATVDNFIKAFKAAYVGHGGRIERDPLVLMTENTNYDHDTIVTNAYNSTSQANKKTPQIIFFILRDKTSWVYDRLKKNADVRYAIPTQMLQVQHVRKAAPQYCSNVCMKVNAKLGGQTSSIVTKGPKGGSVFFKVPTMMIGVDVSHGNTAQDQASIAGITVSMDKDAAVYCAGVQTNGWRVEIVQPAVMFQIVGPLIGEWKRRNKTLPQHVFYLRDGVSEGQYAHVMEWEYKELLRVFQAEYNHTPKITIIICTKRHHIRFFPEKGDKNGNPMPGTLLEREVTHPFHYDFYLSSHVAIQGTARPVHYNVLLDQCKLKPAELQQILYHQCYQYCRSTTPVSLHPAVYYAHLACARGRHHEGRPTSDQVPKEVKHLILPPRGLFAKRIGKDGKTANSLTSTQVKKAEQCPPLWTFGQCGGRPDAIEVFKNTMWWV